MRKTWFLLLLGAALTLSPVAQADDYIYDDYDNSVDRTSDHMDRTSDNLDQAPGTAPDNATTGESREITRGVYGSPFTVTPAVGALGYQEPTGSYTSRIVEGILLSFDSGTSFIDSTSGVKIGLQSGLLYSHLGSSGSNFFGADAAVKNQEGSNSFLVPIELSVGYAVSDAFLLTLNPGANMLYRSIPNSMLVGRGDSETGDKVDFFPSVGLQAGWAVARSLGITLRGDYVPTPLDDMFTATIGATLPLA